MGRSGEALRAAKLNKGKYYTTADIIRIETAAINNDRKNRIPEMKEKLDKLMAEREAELIRKIYDATHDDINNLLSYLLAISTRVLIEHFGWKPVRYIRGRRTNTERFARLLIDEINFIEDNGITLADYVRETKELYGVEYVTEETNNDG